MTKAAGSDPERSTRDEPHAADADSGRAAAPGPRAAGASSVAHDSDRFGTVAVLMGVSGVGKTTVGEAVARQLGWSYYDADDFHPPANVEKMRGGTPLTDADRAGWLDALHALIQDHMREGRSAIIACSALKASYRERLLSGNDGATIIYLKADYSVVEDRIRARKGHYFDAELLASQYADLEEPRGGITIDAERPVDDVVADVLDRLRDSARS